MIKILQIVPTLGYGGVAQFLLNYYKQMDKNEIRFDFITHGSVEAFHQELIDGGSQIFYFLNSATHIVRNKFKILSNNILPSILPCQKIHLT